MKNLSDFQISASALSDIVRKAVDEQHMSLSEVASRSGLSVPTIARIYSQEVGFVQTKTARRIAEGLGYTIDISKGDPTFEKAGSSQRRSGLTQVQRAKLRKAIIDALDEILDTM
jgi:transcriptional regulator with XRE-family HTH domain